MDKALNVFAPVITPFVRIWVDRSVRAASIRYFDRSGEFSNAVGRLLYVPLPETGCATYIPSRADSARAILAWRSPTETLFLGEDTAMIDQLQITVASLADGCVVDQTGGAWVLRASGERVADLLSRLGGQGILASLGQSKRCRLGDVAISLVRVEQDEFLLVVDRVYAEHLMEWIRISVAQLCNVNNDFLS